MLGMLAYAALKKEALAVMRDFQDVKIVQVDRVVNSMEHGPWGG